MMLSLSTSRRARQLACGATQLLGLSLLLGACSAPLSFGPPESPTGAPAAPAASTYQPAAGTPDPTSAVEPLPNLPTATLATTPAPRPGRYENPDLGVALDYPDDWTSRPSTDPSILAQLIAPDRTIIAILFYSSAPASTSLKQAAEQTRDESASAVGDVQQLGSAALTLADGQAAWRSEYSGTLKEGQPVQVMLTSAERGGRLVTLMSYGQPDAIKQARAVVERIGASISLSVPQRYGIPRDQALFTLGGESNNPRVYDPAVGGGDELVFSGLVSFNPQLQVTPDLAASWDISPDGTTYTFHLRPDARFHNGRSVTAQDVVYSWERAADPKTESNTVLTYLGDIVGITEMHAGRADHIAGLKALDDRTLQVTIDAPKPYFLMKLTYSVANIVDKANVESGPEWYRTPNGTGPYRLIRWEHLKLKLYERNEQFYAGAPAIRYIVEQLYAGVGIRMYETGDVDFSGVALYDADRVRSPDTPLHADLREGVSMCTSYISFDVTQPPFDDPKTRQAFALAVDRSRYIDVVQHGQSIPARGLYPPALPGYNLDLKGLDFNPDLARQRLAESKYGGAGKLPPIIFTTSGFGSDIGSATSALIDMWQKNLGVSIQVENIEPNKAQDELHKGRHGQLFFSGWCADYPDPENFADALFHTGAQQNLGHYSNPQLDQLLEQARVERDVARRIAMYQRAEQLLVDDAAAVFLSHGLSLLLVKPHINGYVLTPIRVPIERYLSIDAARLGE
jgi:oligopeptide transport system substrate-binding protein